MTLQVKIRKKVPAVTVQLILTILFYDIPIDLKLGDRLKFFVFSSIPHILTCKLNMNVQLSAYVNPQADPSRRKKKEEY